MRFNHAVRTVIAAGAAALLLAGCGPATSSNSNPPQAASPHSGAVPPQGTPPAGTPSGTTPAGTTTTGTPPGTTPAPVLNAVDRLKVENDLKQIVLAYQNYWDANPGKGPAKVDDLYPYLEGAGTPPAKGLASGKYKLYLNATITQMTNGTSNTVLAYYEGAPTVGGPVAMADGSVKNMSADEFKKAPKAGK